MSARSLLFITALSLGTFSVTPAFAQELSQPEVENSRNAFTGVINANSVYVRSGPGENYYATQKLDKGTIITVVGIKYDWLKVAPPDGSFCYVAKAYVEKRGDGTLGRITRPDLPARVGSSLNAMKYAVSAKLNQGDDVKIIGEEDEYFKIVPPASAALFINKKYVDPGKPVAPPAIADNTTASTPVVEMVPTDTSVANTAATDATDTAIPSNPLVAEATQGAPAVTETPTTQPGAGAVTTGDPAPATQPTQASAEATYAAAMDKQIDEQPIDELLAGYDSIKSAPLPGTLVRVIDQRLATLKMRRDARAEFLAVKKSQEEASKRSMALRAEREELEQRIKENDIQVFTAIGQLQASSLQLTGRGVLYRLTDPATGRTIVYIRSDDASLASSIGQFIGVKGQVITEATSNLRSITPTAFEAVDASQVGTKVAAQIIPQSLLPKTASTTD